MADEKHLEIIRQGVEVWNKWRKDNPDIEPDLFGVDLINTNLTCANFTCTNLIGAKLSFVKLIDANLIDAHLESATLSFAKLTGATLYRTTLSFANLNNADLSFANLDNATLYQVRALGTNFEGSTLTRACIEDWHTNSQTNLQNVKCNYIYLKIIDVKEEGRWKHSDRRPHNGKFKEGEFAQLFQKALETVDLIFSEGIEWTAFWESFQQLQAEVKSEELSIQAIEKKAGGAFVVRLEVPEEANKAEIEKYIKQEYETKLKIIEANYQKQLQAKDETIQEKNEELIKAYRQEKSELIEVVKTMSNINPVINIINDNKPNMTSGNTYNTKTAGIVHNEGNISGNAKIAGVYNEVTQQDLAQAAESIQQLIDQLQQTNGVTLATAQQQVAKDLTTKAQSDPILKDKLIQLGKFISENSAKTIVSEGVKGVIKLFLLMV